MPNTSSEYYIGLMSGTSVDGVDAALVEFSENRFSIIGYHTQSIPEALERSLLQLNHTPQIDLEQLCMLQHQVADIFSLATKKLLLKTSFTAKQITALGSHGQTIYHSPTIGMSLQIGHPAIIAKQTGITTVADFRVDDMALGGQGAPFAPAFHEQAFNHDKACFVINIGGIANLSFVPAPGVSNLRGYDTGPGNALLDEACRREFGIELDKNGDLAKQGTVDKALLKLFLQHPYLAKLAPKSTGRETFNYAWVETQIKQLNAPVNRYDLIATLTEFTALSIAQNVQLLAQQQEDVWIVGGGALNEFLLSRIQANLCHHQVASSAKIGIDPNAVEACLCAWLAKQRLDNCTINLAATTGASRNAVLGGIWHP